MMNFNFRDAVEFFADDNNEYSKKDLYEAFLVVTRLYLDELISMKNWENILIKEFGSETAEELFEAAANYSPTLKEGDLITAMQEDPRDAISAQFDLLEALDGETLEDDGEPEDPFDDDPE